MPLAVEYNLIITCDSCGASVCLLRPVGEIRRYELAKELFKWHMREPTDEWYCPECLELMVKESLNER